METADEMKLFVWLQNGESLLKFDWATPELEFQYGLAPSEWRADQGYICLGTVAICLPEINPEFVRTATIAGLRNVLQKKRAETEKAFVDLEHRINDLLMIGHDRVEDHI